MPNEFEAFFKAGASRSTAVTRPTAEAAAERVPVGSRLVRADMLLVSAKASAVLAVRSMRPAVLVGYVLEHGRSQPYKAEIVSTFRRWWVLKFEASTRLAKAHSLRRRPALDLACFYPD